MDNYSPPKPRAKPVSRMGSTPLRPSAAARKRMAEAQSGGSPAKKPSVKRETKAPKKEAKMVIGIDLGTTYSGVAFAWSEKVDKISVVMSWDDSNQDLEKVPTAINYGAGNNITWGYGAKGSPQSVEWFKLLLIDGGDLPAEVRHSEQVRQARRRLRELNKTAEDVISDYLGQLWLHCLAKIKIEVGEETVDYSRIHVVVTVPAIWPQYARERTRQAAAKAGILRTRPGVGDTQISFVSEPEAAALSTLSGIDGRSDIHAGDSFVVVDCGGGTCDLISYKVLATEPMILKEVVQGQGGLCGAVFLDDRFTDLLKKKFKEVSEDAWDRVDPEELEEIHTRNWEVGIRNQYTGEDREWTIRLPYSLIDGAQRGPYPRFKITSDDLKQVFWPIISHIKDLVDAQAAAVVQKEGHSPKYINLVGGFGRCRFLYEFLNQYIEGSEVLQARGSGPWTAICRGAVIHGLMLEKMGPDLAVEIKSRISRCSYGVICQEDFDEEKHLEEDKRWDEDQECWKAQGCMKWLVKEGEDVMAKKKPFRENFFKILPEQPQMLRTTIWKSRAQPPPSRKDDTVTKLCDVNWDTKIDVSRLPLYVSPGGESFPQLDFIAEMQLVSGSIEFSILHKGKRQANKNITVDYYDHGDM